MGVLGAARASNRRLVAVVVLALAVVVGGGFALGEFDTPSVVGLENRFASVDDETTTMGTDLVVENPNPVGVNATCLSVAYTVELDDVELARGPKEGVAVGRSPRPVGSPTRLCPSGSHLRVHDAEYPVSWSRSSPVTTPR